MKLHKTIAQCNVCKKPLIAQVLLNVYAGARPNIELVCIECDAGLAIFKIHDRDFKQFKKFLDSENKSKAIE
mgnify:CR=1 FL=1